MKKRTRAWLLELPAVLLLLIAFFASVYVKLSGAYALN